MSRIRGEHINFGNSFVLGSDGKSLANKEVTDAQIIAASIIAEAKKQAQELVNQAHNQASQIVSQASVDAESSKEDLVSDAKQQGFAEGYAEGNERITTELESLVYNVDNFVKCKLEIKNRIIKSVHKDILELIIAISEKICKTELQHNRDILLNVVTNAISQLKEKEKVTIIVHPEMAEKIYNISNDLRNNIHNLEHIKIIEDTAVSPDGTIVESLGSRIDARVSAQIEQISHKLLEELNSTPEIELARELEEFESTEVLEESQEPVQSVQVDELNELDKIEQLDQDTNDKPEQI